MLLDGTVGLGGSMRYQGRASKTRRFFVLISVRIKKNFMTSIYTGAEYSTETLFRELVKTVQNERISDLSEYKSLVDDIVENKKNLGFFDKEEDLPQMKENLLSRWPEIRRRFPRQTSDWA